jgi:hypothetical protein
VGHKTRYKRIENAEGIEFGDWEQIESEEARIKRKFVVVRVVAGGGGELKCPLPTLAAGTVERNSIQTWVSLATVGPTTPLCYCTKSAGDSWTWYKYVRTSYKYRMIQKHVLYVFFNTLWPKAHSVLYYVTVNVYKLVIMNNYRQLYRINKVL